MVVCSNALDMKVGINIPSSLECTMGSKELTHLVLSTLHRISMLQKFFDLGPM